jgi:hypothetical protein
MIERFLFLTGRAAHADGTRRMVGVRPTTAEGLAIDPTARRRNVL